MSTMVTGRAVLWRGSTSWNMSKVRSRNSWIGGGSQTRSAGKTISSARHISRAKPNFRANHRRRILRRFILVGLPDLYRARRRSWSCGAIGYSPAVQDYGFFAAVKRRAGRQEAPAAIR